jgi:hypothetical protein
MLRTPPIARRGLGARVLTPVFDVTDIGRMRSVDITGLAS